MLAFKVAGMAHRGRNSNMRFAIFIIIIFLFIMYLHNGGWPCGNPYKVPEYRGRMVPKNEGVTTRKGDETYYYHKDMPLIFIGGVPRSGTTLMRAMIDAHEDVRCGEETRLVPRLLGMRQSWKRSQKEWNRLKEAGLTDNVINDALSAFILEVIAKHGEPAPRLCNKDPFTLKSMTYLRELFPSAKYILMIRDGRATVHSIISRKVTISGFDITNYRDCLQKWNLAIENMYGQCMQVGPNYCLPVHYEQLVLHPEAQLRKITEFLDLPWDERVLHHEDAIGKPGGISLSKVERSTDQVIKPINLDALTSWVGHIPQEVLDDMPYVAPMLQRLGYDPRANPPNYGTPDKLVVDNTKRARENEGLFVNRFEKNGEETYIKDYMEDPGLSKNKQNPPNQAQPVPQAFRDRKLPPRFRRDVLPNY
ncbi:protein-tyrosine sulfotransferase 1-like [Ptychodera flava]|uniref:protein-tyrosine sulfotransferase 1-like n=1 Tax=Ptychodera flava TaxID=63121 RepID=UPI00396A84CE